MKKLFQGFSKNGLDMISRIVNYDHPCVILTLVQSDAYDFFSHILKFQGLSKFV